MDSHYIQNISLKRSFANQGKHQEGESGILFDLTARGDSQSHRDYASRLYEWHLRVEPAGMQIHPDREGEVDAFKALEKLYREQGLVELAGEIQQVLIEEDSTLAFRLRQAVNNRHAAMTPHENDGL